MSEDGKVSGYFIGFVSLAGTLGFLLNLWGTVRTWKTFNLNLAPYLILFLGTSFSCFALFCTLVMFGYIFIFNDRNMFTCTFYVGWNSVASSSGSTMLSVLSIIRYKIASGGNQVQNRNHVIVVVVVGTILSVYGFLLFFLTAYYNVSSFPVTEYCIHGLEALRANPKFMASYSAPNNISLFLSAFYDCRTYLFIRKYALGSNDHNDGHGMHRDKERKHMLLQLPLKATVLSTSMSLPYIFMIVVFFNHSLTLEMQGYLAFSASLLTVCFRFPIVAAIIFRRNETNMARSQEEERENKRQLELQHARRMNEERKKKASTSKTLESSCTDNENIKEARQKGKPTELLLVAPVEENDHNLTAIQV